MANFNDIYYGVYSKECNNEKVFPYLTHDNDYDVFIQKEDLPKFFEILRKYAKHYENERCYVVDNEENMYKISYEVITKDIAVLDGLLEKVDSVYFINFENQIVIFWVL